MTPTPRKLYFYVHKWCCNQLIFFTKLDVLTNFYLISSKIKYNDNLCSTFFYSPKNLLQPLFAI